VARYPRLWGISLQKSKRRVLFSGCAAFCVCSGLVGVEIGHLAKGPCPRLGYKPMPFNPPDPYRHGENDTIALLPPLLSPFANGAILTLDSVGDYLVCACALPVGNPSYRSRRSQALLGHECLSPLSDNRIPSASARRWGAHVVRASPNGRAGFVVVVIRIQTGVAVTQNL
jgi:hypothetical protein